MTTIINFFIRLWFYARYFTGKVKYLKGKKLLFYSYNIYEENWEQKWGWARTEGKFGYGLLTFHARMDGEFQENYWPALWMVSSELDSHYSEIDIELTVKNSKRPYLNLGTWMNPYSGTSDRSKGCKHKSMQLRNKKLINRLRCEIHDYYIDWNRCRVKFYINGLLCGITWNSPHHPMQIIAGYATVLKVMMFK